MTKPTTPFVHLRAKGVSFVLHANERGVPRVLHWGGELDDADLPALAATSSPAVMNSSFDKPRVFPVLPTERDGWSGSPAVSWHRAGRWSDPDLRLRAVSPAPDSVTLDLADEQAGVDIALRYSIDEHGVISASAAVTNTSSAEDVLDIVGILLIAPLPTRAEEIVDQTGRWTQERRPQRLPVADGNHSRRQRRGRSGHDSPTLSLVGTTGFGFRHGEVWGTHVAWSGNQEYLVERLPEGAGVHGAVLGGGELLQPGEMRLAPGETYTTPAVLFVWGGTGIDSISERLHGYARALPAHPSSARPLVLNTWEAVYFDHDFETLAGLAHAAADVGVERFVLDDGWFRGRADDHAALGDWEVDEEKWPNGLAPLSTLVHSFGMEFGLWFEPEMVSRDSELARRHPDWILGTRPHAAAEWRHQLVLDIANPHAFEYVLARMDAVITEVGVDFIKWDHNRDLHEGVSSRTGRASVHDQTRSAYDLMAALRRLHPSLEIESCASGGARADLGMMAHAQRVWASDTNDPIERQWIQRWTGVLLPPEVVGTHVGPAEAHTTHRVSTLQFRLATALFGHAGIEWDLTACSSAELAALREWAALYKRLRPLIHTGVTVRSDDTDDGALLHGVVSPAGDDAVFAWVRVAPTPRASSPRVTFPGLDRARSFRLTLISGLDGASRHQVAEPAWIGTDVEMTGKLLAEVGVPLPVLNPGGAVVLRVTATEPA